MSARRTCSPSGRSRSGPPSLRGRSHGGVHNLDGGLQNFYFAQIEKVHAGKTMVIHLFDPGEASGNAYLRVLSPDGNIYHYQTFDWTSDDGRARRT